jgi:nitroreductase
MTSAALLGVDTCPMEGLDPAGYDNALGLEGSGFWTVAACPAGYRAEEDKHSTLPKVRFERNEVISYLP